MNQKWSMNRVSAPPSILCNYHVNRTEGVIVVLLVSILPLHYPIDFTICFTGVSVVLEKLQNMVVPRLAEEWNSQVRPASDVSGCDDVIELPGDTSSL